MSGKKRVKERILVVDDDAPSRSVVSETLEREGYKVAAAGSVDSALESYRELRFDIVVSDVRMPDKDGFELLRLLQEEQTPPLVILITAFGDMGGAAQALQGGAFEYLSKPFRPVELKATVARAISELSVVESIGPLQEEAVAGLLGRSAPMVRLYRESARASASDATVLIVGESGSGKELVARAIHTYSPRNSIPMISINCGALTETLLESELFGHVRGAFTGADFNRKGLFEEANGGTLFLDEIGEVSPRMQAQLLRVLQEGEIRPVGADRFKKVNTRIVAATNRDLVQMTKDGSFREDLLYRIMVVVISVPPLRERRDDIPQLVQHFLGKHGTEQKRQLDVAALDALVGYHWPGNVRQLENVVARALALTPGDRITLDDLPMEVRGAKEERGEISLVMGSGPVRTLSELNRAYAAEVLLKMDGNKTKAAELLDIDRKTLYRLLKE